MQPNLKERTAGYVNSPATWQQMLLEGDGSNISRDLSLIGTEKYRKPVPVLLTVGLLLRCWQRLEPWGRQSCQHFQHCYL